MTNIFEAGLFRGKRAFVAGGSSGINLEIASRLAGLGTEVAIFSRSQEKIDAAVAGLREAGGNATGFTGDVRQYEAVDAAISDFAQAGGGIDFVISGAAGNFVAPAAQMSANAFRTVVEIDLMGTYHVLRASFAHLRRPGASLINISAVQSQQAIPFQAHVCSAKAGIDMLTKALAVEWGPAGVRVNAILPGPIADTEGMRRLSSTPELAEKIARAIPLQRYGTKAEVANLAVFLCSDAASYVSGAILACDGGQLAGNPSGIVG
ncbi:SDR family oxidoreductase [Sandaracinobacter neustonicus]|uniref:SDR family oxidoreductase n=1 Tax=Sandaracinobacter neustonicus TaxID=1715348 RepID=A0A501XKK5_9SPHN|nr:SDR family oxidoreductase [Sandaracinobacter neustonicus]TPE60985.1 SDR family oxidoreductase [Sandaracinobacter neustonicus]